MADTYIDAEEIQYYGAYASRQMRRAVAGLVGEPTTVFVRFLADTLDTATTTVTTAIDASRAATSGIHTGARAKQPLRKEVWKTLGRFSKHLDSHVEGTVDRKLFFVADGTLGGMGKSAHGLLQVVIRISTELTKDTCPVRERETWLAEFRRLSETFSPVVEHADNARSDRTDLTPEVKAGRDAWLSTYKSCKSGVDSVLRLAGKLHLKKAVFYDLTVPSGTKLTAVPADPPVEPEEPEPAEGGE